MSDPAGSRCPFSHAVRVPYAHVDAMGVVYYAHYFVYFEMARAELLRRAGQPYGAMEKQGMFLPVVEAHCAYRRPARFDDALVVGVPRLEFRGSRLHLEYEVTRGAELIAAGYTDHACVTLEGRVLRPTPDLRRLVESYGQEGGTAP